MTKLISILALSIALNGCSSGGSHEASGPLLDPIWQMCWSSDDAKGFGCDGLYTGLDAKAHLNKFVRDNPHMNAWIMPVPSEVKP